MNGEFHVHRCPICWSLWDCQDLECGEGIVVTKYDVQYLTDCGIERQERNRECDECLHDPDLLDIVRAPDPEDDYELARKRMIHSEPPKRNARYQKLIDGPMPTEMIQ